MKKSEELLEAVLKELRIRSVPYNIVNGKKHIKVRFSTGGQSKMVIVSRSPSDHHALQNARRQICRMLA